MKIPKDDALTPTQTIIRNLILLGMSANEAAEKLKISVFTVSNHTRAVLDAYETSSRSKIIALHLQQAQKHIKVLEKKK